MSPKRIPLAATVHELKCWPEFFEPAWRGLKRAEFRRDDRGYRTGDRLRLREWRPVVLGVGTGSYTGRELLVLVTHCASDSRTGIPAGWVVLSFLVLNYQEAPTT